MCFFLSNSRQETEKAGNNLFSLTKQIVWFDKIALLEKKNFGDGILSPHRENAGGVG
jgi:hypothetical protein